MEGDPTLKRVLATAERAMVVSLHDGVRIIYANDAMRRFLPGIAEDMLIEDFRDRLDDLYEHARHPPLGLRVTDKLRQPGDTATRHTNILGGIWVVGSHLPTIEAYPPCALLTFHRGSTYQEARAWRVHRPLAHAAGLALELDEARRELEVCSTMVVQAYNRIGRAAEALVEYQADRARELAEGGITLD